MEARLAACPHCSAALPAEARFCPACGRRLEGAAPVTRYFGAAAPLLVLALLALLLVVAIVLLALGRPVPALLLVAAAGLLLPVFLTAARRSPGTGIARYVVRTADRVRDEAGVFAEAVSTWSHAGRDVVRLRHEQFRLRRELDEKLRALGRSVLEVEGGSPTLVAEVRALEERLQTSEAELGQKLDDAREKLREERAAVAETEVLPPDPPASDAAADTAPDPAAAEIERRAANQ